MKEALQYIHSSLSALYPDTEIRSFWLLIMEDLTGFSRIEILTNKNSILSAEQNEKIKTIVSRLKEFEPIQYILGKTEFYGLTFQVNKQVLIPRPETEELVDWVLKENLHFKGNILDIGTGSGCIAIALAKNLPQATISAVDISEDTLAVAKRNASINGVNIDFQLVDILSVGGKDAINRVSTEDPGIYDIIISNPPYVCHQEKAHMQPNVLKHEPSIALFVADNDPLLFYRQIANFALKNLISDGKLFFEINQAFGKETVDLIEKLGFSEIVLRKDLSGKDRMIKAIRK